MNRSERTSSWNPTVLLAAVVVFLCAGMLHAQTPPAATQPIAASGGFRIGERLTYNVSMGRFRSAGYAEMHVVSAGQIGDKPAIELRAKFKTLELASAAFYLIDETRTTLASPVTGLPLQTTISQFAFGLPTETVQNHTAVPATHFDLVTMIYRMRQSGGTGSLTMQVGEKVYSVSFQPGVVERQSTDAGEFDTTVISVQSDFFTEHGITAVRVNLSNDEARVPVLFRLRTPKGSFRATLAGVHIMEPEVVPVPTPVPVRTPVPERTPKPVATPTPYIDNQPLPAELAFELGERLEYVLRSGTQPVAKMSLLAKERRQINGLDTLLLEAQFSNAAPGSPFSAGDFIRAYVDPETLAPRQIELRFAGPLRSFGGTAKFEQSGSVIVYNGSNRVDAPVGTHSILSLLYAARSFNLKPSRDANNPINDTRVAVFWESQPYVFSLRPSAPEMLTIEGKPVAAQLVSVTTKNSVLDQLNIKFWLANDGSRVPVRIVAGPYQADLVSVTKN